MLDEVDKIVGEDRPNTSGIEPCPSLFAKGARRGPSAVSSTYNQFFTKDWGAANVSVVRPFLKKSTLDLRDLGNYPPVSNQPLWGKVIEQGVARQLQQFSDYMNCLDLFQAGLRLHFGTDISLPS